MWNGWGNEGEVLDIHRHGEAQEGAVRYNSDPFKAGQQWVKPAWVRSHVEQGDELGEKGKVLDDEGRALDVHRHRGGSGVQPPKSACIGGHVK